MCYTSPFSFAPIVGIIIYYIYLVKLEFSYIDESDKQQAQENVPLERSLSINIKAQLESLRSDMRLMNLKQATIIQFISMENIMIGYEKGQDIGGLKQYIQMSIAQYNDFAEMITSDRFIDDIEVYDRLNKIANRMNHEI